MLVNSMLLSWLQDDFFSLVPESTHGSQNVKIMHRLSQGTSVFTANWLHTHISVCLCSFITK